jgi:signal transduction histidine kinase
MYTLGAFAYGALAVVWLRERRQPAAEGGRHEPMLGVLSGLSLTWFLCNIILLLLRFARVGGAWPVDVAVICLAFLYPPIIMHLEHTEAAGRRAPMGRWWWRAIVATYAVACAIPLASVAVFAAGTSPAVQQVTNRALTVGLTGLFVAAAVYGIALGALHGTDTAPRAQQARWWTRALFALTIVLFLAILCVSLMAAPDRPALLAGVVEVAAKSLPLLFFFVASYHENRFEFFDLFVKRGAALLVSIVWLTAWFAVLLPLLHRFDAGATAPWLYALLLVPAAVSLPWIFARLGSFLDRRWLGRRFSTIEAMTYFVGRLRQSTSEAQLVEHAQEGLREIFGAPVAVAIGAEPPAGFTAVQEIPIRSGGANAGRVLLGPRTTEAPYFSEDLALAQTLADVFGHVLENLGLQLREQAQERRARELVLHASRSELKALRAQINPHFLFNALNAIAGLIHREPAVADRTIEQLADVFRYALRDAGSEWARLDDEIDFVRAYLDIERARFGERLQASVVIDEDARGARVPTMIVQTLVENAMKHGVASVLGQATVAVHARRDGDGLVVSVTDNGPGFPEGEVPAAGRRGSGYGLANVRQRLEGYFGARAALEIRRDVVHRRTIVSVSLPFARGDARAQGPAVTERVM